MIRVIAVGRIKSAYYRDAIDDYARRATRSRAMAEPCHRRGLPAAASRRGSGRYSGSW